MNKKNVVSGIRPTGKLHIGNYFGAVNNFVKLQEDYNCFFFVADYHSLTTHPNSKELKNNSRRIIIELLSCGLNPDKATLYLQSSLPEICELYLILNMFSYKGELERCASFKEKARNQPDNINAGLLTYPTLMAADVLIHSADYVPVGKDQEQHLEMVRDFAQRFNKVYNTEIFSNPVAFNFSNQLIKIPGLDGSGKMGKSDGNAIYISDDEKEIKKKILSAVTDSGPKEKNSKKPEVIQNIFSFLEAVSSKDVYLEFENKYNECTIKYSELKNKIAEDTINFFKPIREKILELENNPKYIEEIMEKGGLKAKENGKKVINKVRELVGINI